MKFNISKSALFIFLTALGAGSMSQITQATSGIAQEQYDVLHNIHCKIRRITDISLYLVSTLENPKGPYKLDEIVLRMESVEPLIAGLEAQIKAAIDKEASADQDTYYKALEMKHDMIQEIRLILKQLASILRNGLLKAVPEGKTSPALPKFLVQIKKPIKKLSDPDHLNRLEKKLAALHSLVAAINTENACMIQELMCLLGKIRHLSESGNGSKGGYSYLSSKLPKKRGPFKGIPQKLDLDDWIGEMRGK